MQNRDELLDALALADQDGNIEAVNQIAIELKKLDESATMTDLVVTGTPESEKQRTTWEYVKDQMTKRYGDWADLLVRGGMNTAYDPRVWDSLPEEGKRAVQDRVAQNKSAEYAEKIGYQGYVPQSETEKYLGVAGAAAVDPINLLPVGRVFTGGKYLLNTTKPYALALFEWTTGTASEVAGYAGAEAAAEVFKGTEYEGTTIDHLSRFATAFAAGTAPSAFTRGIQSTIQGYRAGREALTEGSSDLTDLLSNQSVKAVLDDAIKSQGDSFTDRLKAAEKLQEEFPDLVLPLVDVVGQNAVLSKEFRKLYATHPTFRQKYDEAAKKVQEQFEQYQKGIFPSTVESSEQVRIPLLDEAGRKAAEAQRKANQKLTNIETVRSKLADRYDEAPLSANVEKAAKNLSESAEKTAREAASVYYTQAFDYAKTNGIQIPAETVGKLWTYAQAQRKADLFADFPSLYRKINSIWSPKKTESAGLVDQYGGLLTPKETTQFSSVSVEELDSLKRELNKAIRSTSDRSKQIALNDLKDELDRQLKTVDPKFSELYKQADKKYYEGVGLPTSLEGYRSIDSARFSTTVAESLTKPDQVRDYLNFVGRDAGVQVVRDALLLKARRSIINSSGEVDPNKLKAFVARNSDVLNEVPEVRAILTNDALLMDRINRGKAKIDSNYNTYALEQSEGLFKALNNKNLDKIADEVLTNPSKRSQYLEQVNSLSESNRKLAITGLRQSLLDKAFTSNDTAINYISKNRETFDEVFGEGYSESLENLAALRDILETNKNNLVASAIDHRQSTGFKETAGFSEEEFLGTIRNQVMSAQRKALHLLFKAKVTKSKAKADKAMADVLLDTKGLEALNQEAIRLREAVTSQSSTKLIGKTFWEFSKKFSSTLGGYITLGGARGISGATINDELENESSMLPTLEEDDWLFAPK